jgi:hypothetical protein
VEERPQGRSRPSILAGQLLASGFTAFFLTFLIGEGVAEGFENVNWEGIGLSLVLAFAALSVLVAWVDPSLGSRLLLVTGVVLAPFIAVAAGSNQAVAATVLSAPYFLSALAIWFGVRRLARRGGPTADA